MKKQLLTVLSSMALVLPALAADLQVQYPAGYRNWHHVKSMVIDKGHPLYEAFGGVHHVYANPKALAGYKSGKFPDGAIIVFDLLEAKSADNAVTEGARKVVGVMHKDAKKFAATGGWGFEGFGGGDEANRVVRDNAASACFACHEPKKDHDYVFSRLRD
ncbi:MAG: cytochrome P460 family protein [Steroidobacteraceae bacterium]|nr:cytochrome P460 family protein [Steroidobacteraceae bacterium]MBP7013345.1 cytochrome P460 family protein [Steroidobacteraceae bacterium]